MQVRTISLLVALSVGLGACTYITPNKYREVWCALDEDGDGDPKCNEDGSQSDCDDANPAISSLSEEILYDGWSNNCGIYDDIDGDDDGYPGVDRDEYLATYEHAVWPPDVQNQQDCDDADATINPGVDDAPYDAIDADCAGDNDFDLDKDGYAATYLAANFTSESEYLDLYASTGFEDPTTDCRDDQYDVNPGSTTADVPYDGKDIDCGGENDFDWDLDGWMPDDHETAYNSFRATYRYPDLPEYEDRSGDCDDTDEAINPAETEVYYDGVDANCDDPFGPAWEFDQDADGYIDADTDQATFLAYLAYYAGEVTHQTWVESTFGATVPLREDHYAEFQGDCDDTDDTVYPFTLEGIGDGVDQDCDGGDSTSGFEFNEHHGTDYSAPSVLGDDFSFVVSFRAGTLYNESGASTSFNIGVGWLFEYGSDELYPGEPWSSQVNTAPTTDSSDVLGSADAIAYPGGGFYYGYNYVDGGSVPRFLVSHVAESAGSYSVSGAVSHTEAGSLAYDDLDIRYDATTGYVHSVHCDASAGTTVLVGHLDGSFGLVYADSTTAVAGSDCFVLPPDITGGDAEVHVIGGGSFTYNADDATMSSPGATSYSAIEVVSHDDWLVLTASNGNVSIDDGDGTLHSDIFATYDANYADAMTADRNGDETFEIYAAAAVDDVTSDGHDDVIIGYGTDPADDWTIELVPLVNHHGEMLDAKYVGIHATDERVMVVAVGEDDNGDDYLGWYWLF